MTASTMFMDVVANFARAGPMPTRRPRRTSLERGPVRLRSALQFSLNIPAIKAGFINGLEHQFNRLKDFGLSYPAGSVAVASESIGTIEIHPIDLVSAYGMIGNGGVLVPHHTILRVLDGRQAVWPATNGKIAGSRVVSKQAAYSSRTSWRQLEAGVNPFGASGGSPKAWAATRPGRRRTRRARRTTTATCSLRLPAPVKRGTPPVAGSGCATGQLANDASCRWTRPLRCGRHLSEVSRTSRRGVRGLSPGSRDGTVDAFTGMKPARDRKTVKEMSSTAPLQACGGHHLTRDVDEASGLLWQEGCSARWLAGVPGLQQRESSFKSWQKAILACRSGRTGAGRRRRAGRHANRDSTAAGYPFGRTWGGRFRRTKKCPHPERSPRLHPGPARTPVRPPSPIRPDPGNGGKLRPSPSPDADGQRRTIVAPSPPPRSPAGTSAQRVVPGLRLTASRSARCPGRG